MSAVYPCHVVPVMSAVYPCHVVPVMSAVYPCHVVPVMSAVYPCHVCSVPLSCTACHVCSVPLSCTACHVCSVPLSCSACHVCSVPLSCSACHVCSVPLSCSACHVCRFIRGRVSFADQSEREAPPKGSSVVNLLYGSKQLRDAFSSIASLYESFVGPMHFRVMSHLLGYQGIAMILEQLLHIVEGQVGRS